MPLSKVTTLHEVIEIDLVESVVITDTLDDETGTNTFVRAIKIFGKPLGKEGQPVLEVRLKSAVKDHIEVMTPSLYF